MPAVAENNNVTLLERVIRRVARDFEGPVFYKPIASTSMGALEQA
jgi:hypothetical protein